MTPKISLITALAAALVLAVPAYGDSWGADRQSIPARFSPDVLDRAVAAEQSRLATMLDAREQSLVTKSDGSPMTNPLIARERSFAAKREAQLLAGTYPDAFERAVVTHRNSIRNPVVDDRFRIDPTSVPVSVSAPSSGRDIEWPQIGIGFGLGILLALGLVLGLRAVHTRPLAH